RCLFDLKSGQCRLSIDGRDDFAAAAPSPVKGPGKHRVRFANVDDQLLTWVDNRLLKFDADTRYVELNNHRPTVEDLTPVRIGASGATLSVAHLRIDRDIYYIATHRGNPYSDYTRNPADFPDLLGLL